MVAVQFQNAGAVSHPAAVVIGVGGQAVIEDDVSIVLGAAPSKWGDENP